MLYRLLIINNGNIVEQTVYELIIVIMFSRNLCMLRFAGAHPTKLLASNRNAYVCTIRKILDIESLFGSFWTHFTYFAFKDRLSFFFRDWLISRLKLQFLYVSHQCGNQRNGKGMRWTRSSLIQCLLQSDIFAKANVLSDRPTRWQMFYTGAKGIPISLISFTVHSALIPYYKSSSMF